MNSPPPEFPRHDPATAAFWDVRFDADFTPWDQGGVPQCLRDYVARHPLPQRTLIPGCGEAHEARFLLEKAWDVTAIDFSTSAVTRARRLLGPLASHVQEADFFAEEIGRQPFGLVYERAFLCALPRAMRARWAGRVAQLLPTGGRLIGFFFFDDNDKGPPFGISVAALDELLSANFIRVEESVPPDSIAVFAGKEKWQVWQRK